MACFAVSLTTFGADKAETEKPAAAKPPAAQSVPEKLSKEQDDWLFVDNGSVRLGVKKSSGAGIAWISESKSERNLVNHFDRGRQIQQSYYGREDGSLWDKQPWTWNPVQGGDWKGNPAKVLEMKSTTNSIYAKTQAKHWASGADLPDVVFEQWITIAKKVVVVRYRMTYSGTETHPVRDQEIPAIFLAPDLETLVCYDGDKAWTNDALNRSKPGWPNETRSVTENWAAYVDRNDFGIGAYVPQASRVTCYRFGDGREDHGSCSYFAPVTQFAITPKKIVNYDLYLVLGTTKEIRENVYMLHDAFKATPPGFSPSPPKK